MLRRWFLITTQPILALATGLFLASGVLAAERSIIVQSTTSTANSGLYDYLLPAFERNSGVRVHVVAVGTGQAIKNASNCDGDVLLVHAKAAEEAFVAGGHGIERFDLMYNDFIIVGPPADPAGIGGSTDAASSLRQIAAAGAPFASRGDDSGTHKKEMVLWAEAGLDPTVDSGTWYREMGSGMGATLNAAVGMGAYALADRGTWISFQNKGDHNVLVQGDERLFNQYGVTLVDDLKCPNADQEAGGLFIEWLLSDQGQKLIGNYKLNGQQLFFPNGGAAN